jgi:hypothetical protein
MSRSPSIWALTAPAFLCGALLAQDPVPAKSIEDRLREMQERYEQRISALENEVRSLRTEAAEGHHEHPSEIERAIAGVPPPPHGSATPHFHLSHAQRIPIDISMDILMTVGTSTEREASIQTLEGGGHDPKKRGFTLNQVELAFTGQVAPCFTGDVSLVTFISPEGETEVELEEAFLTTTCLPRGMHLEAGQFFTEFGRINPRHPHDWDFVDQPVVNSRMFGPDGMRGPGARLGWLLEGLPWFCDVHVGVQNANGETMTSFYSSDEAGAIGGRPFVEQDVRSFEDLVYYLRVDNGFDLCPLLNLRVGASTVFGPNATGTSGYTWIAGTDVVLTWRPCGRAWPFVTWQSELMYRNYRADDFFDEGDPLDPFDDIAIPADTLEDWGLYSQVLWGFRPRWIAGARYEFAGGAGEDVDPATGLPAATADDPFRDDRHRISGLLTFIPTDHSRLRLQYNFDRAQHLDEDAHSIWLSVEFLFGKHAAHHY